MIYRFRSAGKPYKADIHAFLFEEIFRPGRRFAKKNWEHPPLGGAFHHGYLDWGCEGIDVLKSPPKINNPRVRFFFTEAGFHRFGPALMAEAKRLGQVLRVERQKNPKRSQIVYQDRWQVAILPERT